MEGYDHVLQHPGGTSVSSPERAGLTMACIFCKIIAKEIPAEFLFENDCAIAILDVNPIHYGHALVIPKHHHKDFLEVPENELPASCMPSTLFPVRW